MSTPTKMLSPEVVPVLTAMDRCDNRDCGAQAAVEVAQYKAGVKAGSLLFCGHHLNKHADALDAAGYFTASTKQTRAPEVCTS